MLFCPNQFSWVNQPNQVYYFLSIFVYYCGNHEFKNQQICFSGTIIPQNLDSTNLDSPNECYAEKYHIITSTRVTQGWLILQLFIINNKTNVLLPQAYVTLGDFGYYVLGSLVFLVPKILKIIWLSNILTLSLPEEGCYRNVSCALN